MRGQSLLMVVGVLAFTGCETQPRMKVAEAIDLCGNVGKLWAANTYYMGDMKSLFVDGKVEKQISYPELTPELRASAMRSTSHCINLQLQNITPETYDRLMALEATNAAAAEHSLTSEQLEILMVKGYKKVADILREAGVSETAITKVTAVTKVDLPPEGVLGAPKNSPEMQALIEINTKIGSLETTLKAMNGASKPSGSHQSEPLIKVLFPPRAATLDSAALLALHKAMQNIGPDTQLSVVGSADANGDELRNMELSRQRAQSVAIWLMLNRQIEARNIHVSARGAQKGAAISRDDRSVTVFKY